VKATMLGGIAIRAACISNATSLWYYEDDPKSNFVAGVYQMLQLQEITESMLDYTIVRLRLTLCYLLD